MNKVQITGKMWNEITAMQDQLVLLHNGFEDNGLYLTWHLSPWVGVFSCFLFNMDGDMVKDLLDNFTWYVDVEVDGHTQNDALNKITEWEKKYGLLNDEH